MFNLQQFIADHVICRPTSMFAADIEANKETLQAEIRNKSVCVIGGAGSIGSSFIKAVLPFKPSKLIVIDLNENGLAELTRDLRSTYGMYVPAEYRAYTLNFADPISVSYTHLPLRFRIWPPVLDCIIGISNAPPCWGEVSISGFSSLLSIVGIFSSSFPSNN